MRHIRECVRLAVLKGMEGYERRKWGYAPTLETYRRYGSNASSRSSVPGKSLYREREWYSLTNGCTSYDDGAMRWRTSGAWTCQGAGQSAGLSLLVEYTYRQARRISVVRGTVICGKAKPCAPSRVCPTDQDRRVQERETQEHPCSQARSQLRRNKRRPRAVLNGMILGTGVGGVRWLQEACVVKGGARRSF